MNKSKDDNRILTAVEVSGLNLWGTKLVTLSVRHCLRQVQLNMLKRNYREHP